MEIIRLEKVTKSYGGKVVLNQIEKSFHKGESIALMGHNGCGKSTLLKIIANLTAPTSGKVRHTENLLFHYIPEKFPPVPLSARAYLMHMGSLSGLERKETEKRIDTLGSDFFLSELLDTQMRALSKGSLQKVGVMQALIRKPDVLLLDEPLSGQDVDSQKVFIEKVNEMRSMGVTVFMSCHEKYLVNAISEKVYTIREGKLEAYQPPDKKIYSVILENCAGQEPDSNMTRYGRFYRIKAEEEMCDRILPELLSQGWKIRGMENESDK